MPASPIKGPVLDLPHVEGRKASAAQVATLLETHGAVVVDDLVPTTTMDELSKDLQAASGCFYGAEGSFAGAHTIRNAGKPLGESKIAQELALHPLIQGAIQQRLGRWCKRFVLGTCSAICVEPPPSPDVAPAPPQVLHRDESMWGCTDWPWLPQTTSERPELAITVMWAVSDFSATNGATRVIPGSHRWPRSGNESQEEDDDLAATAQPENSAKPGTTHSPLYDEELLLESVCVPAVMCKGSVLLWTGATIHGQGAHAPLAACTSDYNNSIAMASQRRREGLLFIYNVGWLRPEHNFHWAMPPHVWEDLPPALQVLMGKVGTNRVGHEWYTGPVYAQPLLGTANGGGGAYPTNAEENDAIADTFVSDAK